MSIDKLPYEYLDTPCVLVNLDQLEANIHGMSHLARKAGVGLRPHTKVHESAWIAQLQLEAGACGIEVGPIDQAEVMFDNGIHDIIAAHPFYGAHKLETLKRIASNPRNNITVVVDMVEQAMGIAEVGREIGRDLPVLLKIDTGDGQRYGVPPGEPAVRVAQELHKMHGIHFAGVYGHEMGAVANQEWLSQKALKDGTIMCETAKAIREAGIPIDHVSIGASPTLDWMCKYIEEGRFPEITEIHPGNRVIGDIGYMMQGGNTRDTCAVTVLASVMSTAHDAYAILDAGYKTFGADSLISRRDTPNFFWEGKPSFGSVEGRPGLWLGRLAAETSCVYYKDPNESLSLGERLEIVPNNATLVINIHSSLYGVRKGEVERVIPVTGRGMGN